MYSTNSPAGVAPLTPPLRRASSSTPTLGRGTIQPSPRTPHISPSAAMGTSDVRLSPTHAISIPRRPHDVAEIDATLLFEAVSADDAEAVMRLLHRHGNTDVRHPQSRETVLLAAARCGARRVVESLLHDDHFTVVDEPVSLPEADGTLHVVRAIDVAARHAQAFSSASISLWHCVQQEIERHESGNRQRLKSGLRELSHAHTRRPSGDDRKSFALEDKAALAKRLDEMIDRIRHLIELKPEGDPVVMGPGHGRLVAGEEGRTEVQPRVFIRCNAKVILKQERETLRTLRPSLQRWSDFIQNLSDIGARPLPDPHARPGTLHDTATLDREGEVEPLLKSLEGRSHLDRDMGDPRASDEAEKVLNAVMDERTRTGDPHRPTAQQVLLAQAYFERLPDDLLQDRLSLQRHIHSVLEQADEAHGGRPALLETMETALHEYAQHMRSAEHIRKLYGGVWRSTEDQRADTQAVAVHARHKMAEAKSHERLALQIVQGAGNGPSPRIDDLLQQAATLRSQADAAPENSAASVADCRSRAADLEGQADALSGSRVRDYRVLKQYLQLETSDPAHLEVHAVHLMAACLRLARQYADHRDGFGRSADRHRDVGQPDELLLRHAERQVLRALDYRLAEGLVVAELPDTTLHAPLGRARGRA